MEQSRQGASATDVVARMRHLILSGQWRPGDRLPPERQLAQHFGISRSSLREGIRTLTALGVLQTRHGSGSRVAPNASLVLDLPLQFMLGLEGLDVDEVEDAWIALAGTLASRAALTAQSRHLRDLATEEPGTEAYFAILGDAAGNPPLAHWASALRRAMTREGRPLAPARYAAVSHRALLKALETQNPAAAADAMASWMEWNRP